MPDASPNPFRLGDFEMDFGSGDLRHESGRVVRLKPQPARVLRMLVDRPGETVLREEIQREVWGEHTFVDFERGLNSCIKQIRAAFEDDPDRPRYVETIPRRGYRLIASVSVAVSREHAEAARLNSSSARGGRIIRRFALVSGLAITALAAGSFAVLHQHARVSVPGRVKMAVLPFENLSGDPGQDFLGDGLAEEMITQLGELAPPRLGVIARTSAAQYRHTSKTAGQIGAELQVAYVLEGSLRRDGRKLHVTAQLIQTSDQTQLWAAAFDRDSADTLSIESDMAARVARSLALKLLPPRDSLAAAPQTANAEAHDAYLRGRYAMNRMTLEGFREARSYFEQAVRLDPNFALAWSGLADSHSLEPWWGGASPKEAFPKARAAVEQALRLDDGLAEAHTSMGFIRLYYDWDFAGAEQEFERALQLQPGLALAHYWYAGMLSAAGRHADAIASIQRAQELDPMSPLINADAGWYYFYARRYPEALRQCSRALEVDASFMFARECLLQSHSAEGNYDAAAADAQAMVKMRAAQQGRAIPPLAGTGPETLRDLAGRRIGMIQQLSRQTYISPYGVAMLHIALNQKDEAFADLNRARDQRDTFMVLLDVDPRLDTLRSDPRYAELKKRLPFLPVATL